MQIVFFPEGPAFPHSQPRRVTLWLSLGPSNALQLFFRRRSHSPTDELGICPLKRPPGSVRPVSVFIAVSYVHLQYPASFDHHLVLIYRFCKHVFPTGMRRPHRLSSLPYNRSCSTYWKARNGWTYTRARADLVEVRSRATLIASTPTARAMPPTASTTSESSC